MQWSILLFLVIVFGPRVWGQLERYSQPESSPNADVRSSPDDNSLAEQLVASKINQFRATLSLSKLVSNAPLTEVARKHSEDMSGRGFFDHVNPDGLRPQNRVERAGLKDFSCGENLYMVTSTTRKDSEEIASEAFTGWVNSPGHLSNMVVPSYDTGGVGVFIKSKLLTYDIYVTHLLCKDISEYNRLQRQYEEAYAFLSRVESRYEKLEAEYAALETQYVNNKISTAQLKEAYDKLEVARVQFNTQVGVVNLLVEKMNAAASD